jgi:hypothetical protein
MEFKDKKKAPKEKTGDLSRKKHVFSSCSVDFGQCDSHGCTGHRRYYVTCSCGYAEDVLYADSIDAAILKHRLAVAEHHLGLSFTESD